jgi:hypothetical protein
MWRYVAGCAASLLLAAAGWLLFSGSARSDAVLPPAPQATAERPDAPATADDSPVPEASARTREEKRFDRYDKDRNGGVAREEYLAARRKAFAKLDVNGDGRLTFDEWAVKSLGKFAAADRDKSGVMDRTEFATTAVKRTAKPRCTCPPAAGGEGE